MCSNTYYQKSQAFLSRFINKYTGYLIAIWKNIIENNDKSRKVCALLMCACRRFGRLILTDRSVSHGRYRRLVRLHLRRKSGRYWWLVWLIVSENRLISTIQFDSYQKKSVDGRYQPSKKNRSTSIWPTNLQKNKKGSMTYGDNIGG